MAHSVSHIASEGFGAAQKKDSGFTDLVAEKVLAQTYKAQSQIDIKPLGNDDFTPRKDGFNETTSQKSSYGINAPVLPTLTASNTYSFDTTQKNAVLYNVELGRELVKACGKNGLETAEQCLPALNKATMGKESTLTIAPTALRASELFLSGRSPEEITAIQKLTGASDEGVYKADGISGSKTQMALANFRAVYGDNKLKDFKRTDISPLVNKIFTSFTGGKEGSLSHQAGDFNITMIGGTVPEGLMYKVSDTEIIEVKQGKWKDIDNFDPKKLDTSKAFKKVDGITIRRSSFKTDEDFSNFVLESFTLKAKKKIEEAGVNWASMDDTIKETVVNLGWNIGEGFFNNKESFYKELVKEKPNQKNLHEALLTTTTFTNDRYKTGVETSGASVGLANRRATDWNILHTAVKGEKIVKVQADNTGDKTIMKYYGKNNKLIHSDNTNRKSVDYKNEYEIQTLGSNGQWINDETSKFTLPKVSEPKPADVKPVGESPK